MNNTSLLAREMMFGTREEFAYFQCASCECLQIETVPANIAAHYPANYYSFSSSEPKGEPDWRRRLKARVLSRALHDGNGGMVGRWLSPFFSLPTEIRVWLEATGVRQHSRVLDVGCGRGHLLRELAGWGFTSLTGADPFIAGNLSYGDGVKVLRKALTEVEGEFDCIMMHHSLEHMADQHAVLAAARRLLTPGGCALVRIPLCSSAVFREYGANWVQLDAPRHFFLHSRQSMELLARAEGFSIERVLYDSTAFQFWGSEQTRRGIAVRAPDSYAENPKASPFSREQIQAFGARAERLNADGDGDQACFVLRS